MEGGGGEGGGGGRGGVTVGEVTGADDLRKNNIVVSFTRVGERSLLVSAVTVITLQFTCHNKIILYYYYINDIFTRVSKALGFRNSF